MFSKISSGRSNSLYTLQASGSSGFGQMGNSCCSCHSRIRSRLWSHQGRYLLETVRSVEVIGDQPPQNAVIPQRATLRSRYPFSVQASLYSPDSDATCYKVEYLLYHPYLRLIDEQTIAGFVEAEPVRGRRPADHTALASLPELSPAGTLRYLCLFVLRQLVKDAVRKFAFWGIVSPIVEGADLGSVFFELPL